MNTFTSTVSLTLLAASLAIAGCNSSDNKADNGFELGSPIDNPNASDDDSLTSQPAGVEIKSKVLFETDGAGVASSADSETKAYSKVLSSLEDYAAEYDKFAPEMSYLPTVDFNNQRVIMATLGFQTSAGDSLELQRVYDDGKGVKANIVHNKLASNCEAADTVTMPTLFVSADTTKDIEVVMQEVVKTCTPNGAQKDFGIILQSEGGETFTQLGAATAYDKVLTNQADFEAEYKKYASTVPTNIDFSTQQVVVATLGARSSGGESLSVEQVYDEGDTTKVVVVENLLGSDCMATSVMTLPHIIFTVDTTKSIEVERVQNVESCS